MTHYQVKWTENGTTHFGIVRGDYDPVAKKHAPRLVVDDAVLPVYHVVDEALVTDIPCKFGRHARNTGLVTGGDELQQYVSAEFAKAQAVAAKVQGVVPGAMFRLGVADGLAFYVVVSVRGSKAEVEWRGFGADRYFDHHFKMGGTFSVKELGEYVLREQKMREVFRS